MLDQTLYWIGLLVSSSCTILGLCFVVGGTIEYFLEKFDLTMKFIYFVGSRRRKKTDV